MFINCPFCKALVATNPAADEAPVQGAGDAMRSELSSQIRQTVALETPASTDGAAIAPIAAMLKPSATAAPAAAPDDADREAEPAGPAPARAPVETVPP